MSDFNKVKQLINSERCHLCDVTQGSSIWLGLRKGRITMSVLGSFLIFAKTHEDKIKLAREIIGLDAKQFTEEAISNMSIGTDYEDLVRQEYARKIGMRVYELGFCILRENPIFGGSADGIFENGDLLEVKITTKDIPTHFVTDYSEIPLWYYWQMQGNMFIADSPRCHFVSYSRSSGEMYTRIIPYNHERWINECYTPSLKFYHEYIAPLLEEHSIPDPFETYKCLIDEERRRRHLDFGSETLNNSERL